MKMEVPSVPPDMKMDDAVSDSDLQHLFALKGMFSYALEALQNVSIRNKNDQLKLCKYDLTELKKKKTAEESDEEFHEDALFYADWILPKIGVVNVVASFRDFMVDCKTAKNFFDKKLWDKAYKEMSDEIGKDFLRPGNAGHGKLIQLFKGLLMKHGYPVDDPKPGYPSAPKAETAVA